MRRGGGGLTQVTVGQPFTLTNDEERTLLELAELQVSLLRHRKVGWRVAFVRANTEVSRVLWRAVQRAQEKPSYEEQL